MEDRMIIQKVHLPYIVYCATALFMIEQHMASKISHLHIKAFYKMPHVNRILIIANDDQHEKDAYEFVNLLCDDLIAVRLDEQPKEVITDERIKLARQHIEMLKFISESTTE